MKKQSIGQVLGAALVVSLGFGCGPGLEVEANRVDAGAEGDKAAIGGSFWEDYERTYVGAIMAEITGDGVDEPVCSGTMIADTVFLTAAHCVGVLGGTRETVAFGHDVAPGGDSVSISGEFFVHPQYAPAQFGNDVAVIVLDEAPGVGVATLAAPGLLPAKAAINGTQGMVSGYGVEAALGGVPTILNTTRRTGTRTFTNVSKNNITSRQGPNDGQDCFGDSGGPVWLSEGGEEFAVGLVSWGDASCASLSKYQRLDTDSVRSFLSDFVDLD